MQKSTDLRFLKKILTDTEIEEVRCSDQPDAALWSLWACKEAAYKVIKKQTSDAAFVPHRWSVCLQRSSSAIEQDGLHIARPHPEDENPSAFAAGEVGLSDSRTIPFFLFSSTSYVHCLAADQSDVLDKAVWRVVALPDDLDEKGADPSAFARSRLACALSTALQIDQARIKISRMPRKRGELEPPAVYLDGIKMNIDISLSHDGQFVAYAYLT